jgi:cyclopropane-fatty-acyl-phospholipid synthase
VTARAAELAGFELRDVENLREHYALTLRRWVGGMQAHAEQARRLVDEVTYRIWRLHMAGSAHYFHTGRLELYQTLLVKSGNGHTSLPLTRADWYL